MRKTPCIIRDKRVALSEILISFPNVILDTIADFSVKLQVLLKLLNI